LSIKIHINPDFSNSIDNHEIEKLAELDDKDSIKQLQEVYADYYAVNNELFTLNIDTCIGKNNNRLIQFNEIESKIGLTKFKEFWTETEITQLSRIFDGIFAALLSLRRYPMMRFLGASNACATLAEKLNVCEIDFYEKKNEFVLVKNDARIQRK